MDRLGDFEPSRAAIFEGISNGAIEKLCSRGQVETYESGHLLLQRGQNASELMILREGVVELLIPVQIMGVTRDLTVESKQVGDVVAWSALVHPYRFTLSARCASKCVLNTFDREALHAFFDADPCTGYLFMRNLAGVIGRRLQAMQAIWVRDLQVSAARRLEK